MHSSPRPSLAIIGAGPRGTSLLERIGANYAQLAAQAAGGARGLDVHVIDDTQTGAGRIWRTDQPRDLCMNTLADAVTLFTEPGSTVAGPIVEGPTLYEWCVLAFAGSGSASAGIPAAAAFVPAARARTFAAHPVRAGLAAEYRSELAAMRPESHPSRALYGEYLIWCFERALALLPEGVRVIRHVARAEGLTRTGDGERIALSDGTTVTAGSVVLATGWMPTAATAAEQQLAARPQTASVWVPPESPIEQDLSQIAAGSAVIMRGLGMSFFDTLSLLTLGRGGEFVTDAAAPGGLRYLPSGEEPVVFATSRRGVPFRSKSLYGGLPPRAELRFLRAVDWATEPRPINFDRRLWPRIVGDAFLDHARTLGRLHPDALTLDVASVDAASLDEASLDEASLSGGPVASGTSASAPAAIFDAITRSIERAIAEIDQPASAGSPVGSDSLAHAAAPDLHDTVARIAGAVAPFIVDPADRFDLSGEIELASGVFASPEEFDAWVRQRVAADLREAELGVDSPLKAGLWSLSAARAASSRIGTVGGFDAESRASGFRMLFTVGGMVGSGPPAFRNRQLLALCEAGLVRFIGPNASLDITPDGFASESPSVAGSRVEAPALVDAWMHFHSLDATASPLARTLLDSGRARSFRVARRQSPGKAAGDSGAEAFAIESSAAGVSTGGFDVDPASGRLMQADGTLDPAVHVAGIPADQTLHDTVISPMPGTDPPMLRETDRVARSAISIALAQHPSLELFHTTPVEGALRV
ncbi:hypothetical protein JOF28_001479 [Leucobacter exalbidus]|uniref:FAD-dependent urate hydroxylase HpyO/Asp monooxygenase CreE-like FAD/NAD(P)-binding domain-containing protein n=2 Tax=Leucobacter exalbidus TaxID=662960 RepID=A0A940PSZ3_9MICO|nr:hypothetical protein [Leucobacter exalbidus]